MPWSWVLFVGTTYGQGFLTHHPEVPSAGIAVENGPGALWVNPANISYDPDARFGVFFSQQPGEDGRTSTAATLGTDGLSLGVHNTLRPDGGATLSDWSLDYGTSVALPQRLSVGLLLNWNFIDSGTNYLAYDAGLSWRPLPWFGIGGSAQNIGSPDPSGDASPRSGVGIAVRPAGRQVILGADYVRVFSPDPTAPGDDLDLGVATARLRPVEGLFFRGSVDAEISGDGLALRSVGAGLEVYLGGVGGGYHAGSDVQSNAITHTGFVGSDEPDESIIRSGRRVPTLTLDRRPPYEPRQGLFVSQAESWLDLLERIRRVEHDPGVRGMVITLTGASMSYAQHRELRQRIVALEARGKPCVVYLYGSPGTASYYVASAASRVAMHPAGSLELIGITSEMMHLRGLLDLVGVEPQFVRRSKYKTSPEQYTEVAPSQASLEQTSALVDDLYDEVVDAIASKFDTEPSTVRGWIDAGPFTADEALERGLVDVLLYPDQLEDELERLFNGPVSSSSLVDIPQAHSPWEDPKQIAVITIEGAITGGESSRGGLLSGRTTGSSTVVRQLKRAANDPQVRAIVLRVDSPGGSSFASDAIWRGVTQVQEEGKPVVVSMGGVAASGGYYVSASADAIWAEPNTITGSIGVYSGKFATTELFDQLGVSTTTVARGRNANLRSTSQPWDDVQRARMQATVDATYAQFKDRVAEGRDMSLDEVEAVAQGRVWSGVRAADNGLVDHLGGLQDAIADARRRAGLPGGTKVGLITYSWGGSALQTLAPSIATSVLGPVPRWVSSADEPNATPIDELHVVLEPLLPVLVPLTHPTEGVWLMAPWALELEGR